MSVWKLTYTIQDAKGAKARVLFYLEYTPTILEDRDNPAEYAAELALVIDDIIDGNITSINLTLDVSLPAGLKAAPLPISDVEEGATFIWRSQLETTVKTRVPTFSETLLTNGTYFVDLTDPAVVLFREMILIPNDLPGSWTISPCDSQGEDLIRLVQARESFTRSRKL